MTGVRMPAHPSGMKNNLKPGRPKGALNKRTRLLQRLDPGIADLWTTPKEAMARAMDYFGRKATEILETVKKAEAQGIPISERGPEMKLVRDYTECMVDCAAKLAPYVHARIGEVPVKSDGDAEYVIVVPPVVHASDAWARSVNAKLIEATPIDAKLNGNGPNGHGHGSEK